MTAAHWKVVRSHWPALELPWQVAPLLQTAGLSRYVQNVSDVQHCSPPPSQQMPLIQLAEIQSEFSSHDEPFGRSDSHVPSQWHDASHSESSVHDVGQLGAVWDEPPTQNSAL